ncbi:MAG: AAA family ATPase, partial [Dehalococcoidia bacterium]
MNADLEEVLKGRGQLAMLAGEPGIGKTRVAQELATHAESKGIRVLWGACYEGEGAPPYWPWVQIIQTYLQQTDTSQLQAAMGAGAADIGEIVPEVRDKLPTWNPPPTLEPEQARFRLFNSVSGFLQNAAQTQPLLLILDDLHWADLPSLLLLQFLTHRLESSQLMVLGTYRDVELSRQHPLSEALAQLSREPVFHRYVLRGLSQEDIGHFVKTIGDVEPTPRLVETLYGHTEGNPFFLTEVVRLLSDRGELSAPEFSGPAGISIPEGV